LKRFSLVLLLLLGIIGTAYSFLVSDAAGFQAPGLARIFLWHWPCTIAYSVMLFFGAYLCIQSLRTRQAHWDLRTTAALELGAVFGIMVLATGILFSEVEWGAFWSWDPRQTSFLMVMLIYMAYFVLRLAIPDPQVRAASSAVYFLLSVIPQLFLIFVFPRLPQIAQQSLHPSQTIVMGLLSNDYKTAACLTLTLLLWLTGLLYRQRVRASMLNLSLEDLP